MWKRNPHFFKNELTKTVLQKSKRQSEKTDANMKMKKEKLYIKINGECLVGKKLIIFKL